jgi:hypothetical protein
MSLEPPEQIGFCLDQVSLCYLPVNVRAGSATHLLVFGNPRHWRLSLKPSFTSSNSVLVCDSSIACRTGAPSGWLSRRKITATIGGGVSVAKAQRPWIVVVRL